MLISIYLPIAWKRIVPPKDAPHGVHLTDTKKTAVVYAVEEHGTVWHCVATEEQIAQLKKDAIPFVYFSALNALEKKAGAPKHVFGSCVYEPGDKSGEIKIYKPGKATPEIIKPAAEELVEIEKTRSIP
jgi:hypothetical protein